MRRIFVLIITALLLQSLHAQNLLNSRHTSYLTYVYKLNEEEAREVFQEGEFIDPAFKPSLLYTYPTDSTDNTILDPGHYLRVKTKAGKLEINAFTVTDLSIRVMNNQTDLCIQVFDKSGNIIPDADIYLKRKKISFDTKSKSYRISKTNKQGNLSVLYDGITMYYSIDREYNNSRFKRSYFKFLYATPVKYLIVPVNFTINLPIDGYRSIRYKRPNGTIYRIVRFFGRRYEDVACLFDGYYCDHPNFENHRDEYKGYIVFNKPKYRLNDTVRVKAFITDWKGKPINKELYLNFNNSNKFRKRHLIPYRKGGYEGEFILTDSLKLKLDRDYWVGLETKHGNTLMSGYIRYEDYELKATQLKARVEKNKHYRHEKQFLYVKATDENDFNLPGARVEVKITPDNIITYFKPYVFTPDILWTHKQALDPVGETKIEIPDSIFTCRNMSYSIDVDIYSADNEHKNQKIRAQYCYYESAITANYRNDSVTFSYKINGIVHPKEAKIISRNLQGKTLREVKEMLPYTMKINPFTGNYYITTDSLSMTKILASASPQLQCFAERIGDSIKITTENPRGVPFHYYIYKRNRELVRDYADSIMYIDKNIGKKPYYVSLQYMWGGNIREENYEIPLKDRELKIEVDEPSVIYPGQEVTINVNVKDYKNQPVENVDITAYSLTRKFNYRPPSVPDFNKTRKGKSVINYFNSSDINHNTKRHDLHFENWTKIAGIDSIEYYRFLYPGNKIYEYIDTTHSGITQFAPFVMHKGSIVPVHIIYVDYKPVYFSWSRTTNPYSIEVTPGYHTIKLRTYNREITLSSVYIPAGKKLIFSVSDNIHGVHIENKEMAGVMTQHEKNVISQYMFPYRQNFGEFHAYLRQGERFHILNNNKGYGYSGYIGPVDPNYVTLKTTRGDSLYFLHEMHFEYEFTPGILKMRTKNIDDYLPQSFYSFSGQSIYDSVLTEKEILDNWENYVYDRRRRTPFYLRDLYSMSGYSRLYINLKDTKHKDGTPVNIIFKPLYDNTWLRVYQGNLRNLNLFEGDYKVLFLYPDNKYFMTDKITLKPGGLNYVEIVKPDTLNCDAFSNKLEKIISQYVFSDVYEYQMENNLLDIYDVYQQYAVNPNDLTVLHGKVWDYYTGQPVYGVQIIVKGTDLVHYTNAHGEFKFYAPKSTDTLRIVHPKYDTRSIKVDTTLEQIHVHLRRTSVTKAEKPAFTIDSKNISGIVRDASTGEPLPGVSVVIKGTTHGTVTDINGRYTIKLPAEDSEIIFSYVGYTLEEVNFYDRNTPNINLHEDILALEEVVVVGYGVQKKSDLTGAVAVVNAESLSLGGSNVLQGKAAGIMVTTKAGQPGSDMLYIINGVPMSGEAYEELADGKISHMEILKDASATAIYGSRGVSGVVIVTTDESTFNQLIEKHPPLELDEQSALAMLNIESSSVRQNFSDDAFWQPALCTDKDGNASFTVMFPDDVTRWNTYYLAMNGKKQAGQAQSGIKSYKPLMAQLSVPRFLVEGDSAGCIGKVINYTGGSITVERMFKMDSNRVFGKTEKVKNSIIDTICIVAQAVDSITTGYEIKTENGYYDGEIRDIQVFRKGIEETVGNFMVLNNDSTFSVNVDDTLNGLKVVVDANMLDVIANEAKHVIHYRYLCNEQLASKLKALLVEKQICDLKHTEFANEKHVKKIVKKLEENQNQSMLWGWWNVSETSYWISTHVLEALFMAKNMGYEVTIDTERISSILVTELSKPVTSSKRLDILELLRTINIEFGFQKDMQMIEEDTLLSVTNRFRLTELQQYAGIEYSHDTIFKYQEETLFESMYFNKKLNRYYLCNNAVNLTLMAYRILRNDSVGVDTLQRIRNFFLENRKSGHWTNTYESAEIITTIFPDILAGRDHVIPPKVVVEGSHKVSISKFPHMFELDSLDEITVTKTGDFPVYFSTYSQFWNRDPKPRDDIFGVRSYIKGKYSKQVHLKAGVKTTLVVELTVKKAADYIMLEIPIPAGCSYDSKPSRSGYEVHREYFRNYTGVFYNSLDKGTYRVHIELMPRYTGTYTLNPARAEQMYFPVFYGRNAMKTVKID